MVQRKGVEDIQRQKHAIIAALWSNPNWDEKEADRPKQIKALEESFNKAIELVYNDGKDPDEQEIDWNNPFWAAAKRAYEAKGIKIDDTGMDEVRKRAQVVDMEEDQLDARRRARESVDQA